MGELEDQLRRFPKGRDDIADAAAMTLEISMAPRSVKKKRTEVQSVDELFYRQFNLDRKRNRRHGVLGREW